jgi:hypothetical protein
VCLLGAGASVEAGPPTSNGMARELYSWAFQGRVPPDPVDASRPTQPPTSPGDVLDALWNYLCVATGKAPTIEEIALACSVIHREQRPSAYPSPLLRVSAPFDKVDPRHIEIMELDLVDRLKKVWLPVEVPRLSYLEPLVRLESVYPDETLKVFTLNYDLAIESLCKAFHLACTDGFSDGSLTPNSVPMFGDAGRDVFAEAPLSMLLWKGDQSNEPARIELFKLHGSASWFQVVRGVPVSDNRYETYRHLRAVLSADPFGVGAPPHPLAKLEVAALRNIWIQDTPLAKANVFSPRIVFGSAVKYAPTVPFARMYELLYRYLRRASVCVIVGYSFQDHHVNSLLRDAFNREMSQWRPLNLVVIDPALSPAVFADLGFGGGQRIWHIATTASRGLAHPRFEELVRDLARSGKSAVPQLLS